MSVIVAALGWSWQETEVDPLTGILTADPRDRGPGRSELAALRQRYGVPDLVLCGDRSADRGTGSFPAFLAAALNAAQVLGVVRMESDDDGMVRVHRRLDGGRREVLRVPRPAVVSVEAAGVRLRRAGLPATLASGLAAIPVARAPGTIAARWIRVLGAPPYRPRPRGLPGPSGPALRR